MLVRIAAACGWLVWKLEGVLGAIRLPRRWRPRTIAGLAVALAIGGAVPLVLAAIDPQPQDATVEDVGGGLVEHPERWVRLQGRLVPLHESPTGQRGDWGLLVDAADPLLAIVVRGPEPIEPRDLATVTGRLGVSTVAVTEELPIEATVAGTPPVILDDQVLELDPTPRPVRSILWPAVPLPWLLAVVLGIGLVAGYPIFRRSREIDVLARPMAPGERVPAAVAGRLGDRSYPLAEPAEALVLCRRGPRGGILTAQVLDRDDGPAPPPVQIGGGWTSARVGHVFTARERLPALAVRAERVDAIIMFARVAERDRVAALVSVERS
jgi:hypothetical protein